MSSFALETLPRRFKVTSRDEMYEMSDVPNLQLKLLTIKRLATSFSSSFNLKRTFKGIMFKIHKLLINAASLLIAIVKCSHLSHSLSTPNRATSICTYSLTVHTIPLLLFILLHKLLQRLLLLSLLFREVDPVHRAGAAQAQPGLHALKVEKMGRMAG